MTTIRKRISRPFLAIILLIPVMILLLFNLIVSQYCRTQGEENLKQTLTLITQTVDDGKLPSLLSLMKNQLQLDGVDIIIYNRKGNVSRLFNPTATFVSDEVATLAYTQSQSLPYNEIGQFRHDGDTYYVMTVPYETETMADRVVYITQGLMLDEFVTTINLVLLAVSVLITGIALFVFTRVTNAVAKPIERLTNCVEQMKSDEILMIEDSSNTVELQKLTAEINALNKRIYHYDQSQKNFLHNASHELRTPLMSIQGYADGIEMGVFEDYKGTAHLISDQSKRLTRLVESLLKLARVENFNTGKKLEKLNLSETILEIVNGYIGYAVGQTIGIQTEIAPNLFAQANPELLQGAVGNVISNAIRYAKSSVGVSVAKQGEKAIITVRDDGKGVEDISNIFNRFTKGEGGNFGLGLSIAKTSIDMMNGQINVYNDNGAVFEITLTLV